MSHHHINMVCLGCRQVRTGESALIVEKKERERESLQVGIRIICMWATSAPRGLPFSFLKGESAQTMAVFLDGRKAHFHVCIDTMHCNSSCNAVQIVSRLFFFLTQQQLSLIPSFFIPFASSGYGFVQSAWRLPFITGEPKMRQGAGDPFFSRLDYTLFRIDKSHTCAKRAHKNYHHARLLRDLRIHPSGGSV